MLPHIVITLSGGVMASVLDYGLEVSEFELQSLYYVHLWIMILEKD